MYVSYSIIRFSHNPVLKPYANSLGHFHRIGNQKLLIDFGPGIPFVDVFCVVRLFYIWQIDLGRRLWAVFHGKIENHAQPIDLAIFGVNSA